MWCVLERNYNRATIHHFHAQRLSLEFILFIQFSRTTNKLDHTLSIENLLSRQIFILFLVMHLFFGY
jgi:hypothetical protein